MMAARRAAAQRQLPRRLSRVHIRHGSSSSSCSSCISDIAGLAQAPLSYPTTHYPELEPYDSGLFGVGAGHEIYFEQCGNPDGIPAVFLHGGPGGGCSPTSRRFFDPSFYRIVCLDQRGCGRSKPNAAEDWKGAMRENTTQALVGDLELLRERLGIDTWGLVLGGSWGSTLALAYAQAHPSRVRALLLRGVFLFGPDEVDYLFSNGGTFGQHPAAWEDYVAHIESTSSDWAREKTNLLGAYSARLTNDDEAVRHAAAAAFVKYELSVSKTFVDPAAIARTLQDPRSLLPFAMAEVHYMCNAGFLSRGQLLDGAAVMAQHGHLVSICHGAADYVCQPQAAYRLAQALRAAGSAEGSVNLEFVAGAGHSDSEPGLVDAMVRATDRFRAALL
jgi:proline iminopeptidase